MRRPSLYRYDIWCDCRNNIWWNLQWRWWGKSWRKASPKLWHDSTVAPCFTWCGEVTAVICLVCHLDREGGARGGSEGARLTGAAGVVRALGGGQATGTGTRAQIGRAGVTMVVEVWVSRAWTPHCSSLQGKDRAVRWRRGAGLRCHLLIRGQLEGSQKTCNTGNTYQLTCATNFFCFAWRTRDKVYSDHWQRSTEDCFCSALTEIK